MENHNHKQLPMQMFCHMPKGKHISPNKKERKRQRTALENNEHWALKCSSAYFIRATQTFHSKLRNENHKTRIVARIRINNEHRTTTVNVFNHINQNLTEHFWVSYVMSVCASGRFYYGKNFEQVLFFRVQIFIWMCHVANSWKMCQWFVLTQRGASKTTLIAEITENNLHPNIFNFGASHSLLIIILEIVIVIHL